MMRASVPATATATASSPSPSASVCEPVPRPTPTAESLAGSHVETPIASAVTGVSNQTSSTGRRHTIRSHRSNRKGHYSCDFCRVRKLRCDRPLPCTNCVSRGKKCSFVPGVGQAAGQGQGLGLGQGHGQNINTPGSGVQLMSELDSKSTTLNPQPLVSLAAPTAGYTVPPTSNPSYPTQGTLLAEIQALRRLAQDLEKRVAQSPISGGNDHEGQPPRHTPTILTPNPAKFDIGPTRANLSTDIGEVGEVVAQLERVSMGQISHGPIFVDALVFKTERIQAIPRAPSYTGQSGKPTRCVLLPLHEEAKVLVDKFIKSVSYIYRVVHHPSLPTVIDDLYRQINGQEPVQPGHLVLLLSIIATATHVWAPSDGQAGSSSFLFTSAAQANSQTPLWVKATHDVLNARQNCPTPSLENVQGVAILSFLISNIEGASLRYRALISTGLLLGRELGLHRIDHPLNTANANTLGAEMGRRVWWYLVATDWLMAARAGGPGEGVYLANPDHMMVKKPRNVSDVDLPNNFAHLDPPLSEPTEMSYFIQRVRLAEITRRIIDHNSMLAPGPGRPGHDTHIVAMDVELNRLLEDIPAFFHLENYDRDIDIESSDIFIQAYLLNSLIHTARCKLHINYLSFGPDNTSPAYTFSREACLYAARQLLRGEIQLMRTRHSFVETRLHLAGILYGIFVASIVLLMDAYVTGSPLDEIRRAEVNEALRIVENAKGHSLAATNLHESLTNVLAKHRARLEEQQRRQQGYRRPEQELQQRHRHRHPHYFQHQQMAGMPTIASANTLLHLHQRPDQMPFVTRPPEATIKELSMTDPMGGSILPQQSYGDSQPISYDNQLAIGLEALMEHDGFHWDDLLSGIDSSSFI